MLQRYLLDLRFYRSAGLALLAALVTFILLERRLLPTIADTASLSALCQGARPKDRQWVAYQVRKFRPPAAPMLVAIGGSSMREALFTSEVLSAELSRRTGDDRQALNLSHSSQTLSETLALLDQLAILPGSLVIIHLSPGRFSGGLEEAQQELRDSRLPLLPPSPTLRELLGEFGASPTATALLQDHALWLRGDLYDHIARTRWGRSMWARPFRVIDRRTCGFGFGCIHALWTVAHYKGQASPAYRPHARRDPARSTTAFKATRSHRVAQLLGHIENQMGFNHRVITAIDRLVRARGARPVFLFLPQDPAHYEVQREFHTFAEPTLTKLRDRGVEIVDWSQACQLGPKTFFDHTHVFETGRAHITHRVLDLAVRHFIALRPSPTMAQGDHGASSRHQPPDLPVSSPEPTLARQGTLLGRVEPR